MAELLYRLGKGAARRAWLVIVAWVVVQAASILVPELLLPSWLARAIIVVALLGFPIALEPTTLDFGYTFVATDPDGHRLRVCATDTSDL